MKILLVFAGQGYNDSELFKLFHADQEALSYLNELSAAAGFNLFKNTSRMEDPDFAQLLIGAYQLTLCTAISSLLSHHQVDVAGYSLGEVSAFLVSARASSKDAIDVIGHRTRLMTSLIKSNPQEEYDLLAVTGKFDVEEIKCICEKHHGALAIIASEEQFIIGGKLSDLKRLLQELAAHHMTRSKFLSIHVPSHTPFYAQQANQFYQFLRSKFAVSRLNNPMFSPLALKKIYDLEEEMHLLDSELYSTLDWRSVCHLMIEYQYDLIIDLGPGSAMTSLLKAAAINLFNTSIITVANFSSLAGVKNQIRQIIPG
ncbi:acyltransferase domain-containing protein [Legionella oakridgensis]|uniref:Acyl-carrier-protein S-malonyltransferase n=2 Tax=Legionella oakridgensis TaxID=29423 RepID=W0BCJ6_9GAMM|nr:acyltransferase domain-containing protein [Legionella oakridgensis]AHE67590.1 acyl-carrier-protein S-malonyltransferase [Legionella oakridgensis ATCC 33761 = DSM 21215]ETO92830.1 (acyl-carrier-protein) S-malonyltransferase [Legionella oakridgensis RV-2-2007]KTD37063.1 putative malonyl-CoA acyl-carrier-protein transacylase [Legionella oakridgensis]STY20628.1 putative malonyl-CoA acyl-carrier-protein transacylase [Legionella longbeachae]